MNEVRQLIRWRRRKRRGRTAFPALGIHHGDGNTSSSRDIRGAVVASAPSCSSGDVGETWSSILVHMDVAWISYRAIRARRREYSAARVSLPSSKFPTNRSRYSDPDVVGKRYFGNIRNIPSLVVVGEFLGRLGRQFQDGPNRHYPRLFARIKSANRLNR